MSKQDNRITRQITTKFFHSLNINSRLGISGTLSNRFLKNREQTPLSALASQKVMSINQLVQKHEHYLLQKARLITTNREEAKDLVQDAILRIIEQEKKYDPTRSFKAWSLQVMRNLYINQYNRRKRYRVYAKLPEEMSPLLTDAQNEGEGNLYLEFLNQAIKQLKRPHRKAFQLFFEGYEQKEIAAKFQIPLGTVKYHIFMAKKELQRIIHNDWKTCN